MAQKIPSNILPFSNDKLQFLQNQGVPLLIDGSKGSHTFTAQENGRTVICTNTPALRFPLGLGDSFSVPIKGAFTVADAGTTGMAVVNDPRGGTGSANAYVLIRSSGAGIFDVADGGVVSALNAQDVAKLLPYLGVVTTRHVIPETLASANLGESARSYHRLMEDIDYAQMLVGNFWVDKTVGESSTGGIQTLLAAFDKSDGSARIRAPFGGSDSIVIPDKSMVLSDRVLLNKQRGSTLGAWMNKTGGGKVAYKSSSATANSAALGDGLASSTISTPDRTLSGTFTSSGSAIYDTPIAILGMTNKESFLFLGDSQCMGLGDTFDISGNFGLFGRSVGAKYAYINAGVSGDRADLAAASMGLRASLAAYVTRVILQHGVNDLLAGRTAQQILDARTLMRAQLKAVNPKVQIWDTTILPRTNSTDSWATLANQTAYTAVPTFESERVAFNNALRTLPQTNSSGVIDSADVFETSRNSGKWVTNGVAFYFTVDGLHGSDQGYMLPGKTNAVLGPMNL